MARKQIAPGRRRIDFSPETRRVLQEAAGHRCCFPSCLMPTSGVTHNNGKDCVRGIGVAAHVYSAAEHGPRGRGGLTEEEVRSASNGLWMCASCGRKVDDFQADYPPENLLRMKAERELAYKHERDNHNVARYVNLVGVVAWNECVRKHVAETPVAEIPDVDPSSMIEAFKSEAILRMAVLELYELKLQPKLPAHFAVKPVAAAAAALVRPVAQTAGTFLLGTNSVPTRTLQFAGERAHAKEVFTALAEELGPEMLGKNAFRMDGAVFLTAADPVTGARYDGGVWQLGHLYGALHNSPQGGEELRLAVEGTYDQGSAFNWTFRAEFDSSVHRVDSVLRKRRLRIPYLHFPVGRIEFGHYRELLAKIAAGWKPLAFISLLPHEHGLEDQASLYPHPFEMDIVISAAELADLERDCGKVAAALDVATKWAEYWSGVDSSPTDFYFNDLFFADYIDRDLVWYAYDALIDACVHNRTNPRRWCTEPLIMTSRQYGIVLRYREGALAFERIPIRTGPV